MDAVGEGGEELLGGGGWGGRGGDRGRRRGAAHRPWPVATLRAVVVFPVWYLRYSLRKKKRNMSPSRHTCGVHCVCVLCVCECV